MKARVVNVGEAKAHRAELIERAALGKLRARGSLAERVAENGFTELAVTITHADAARGLPALHRDPFDRTLVAQALVEDRGIVSTDAAPPRTKCPPCGTDALDRSPPRRQIAAPTMLSESRETLDDLQRRLTTLRGHL
jgi:hypothetical protein